MSAVAARPERGRREFLFFVSSAVARRRSLSLLLSPPLSPDDDSLPPPPPPRRRPHRHFLEPALKSAGSQVQAWARGSAVGGAAGVGLCCGKKRGGGEVDGPAAGFRRRRKKKRRREVCARCSLSPSPPPLSPEDGLPRGCHGVRRGCELRLCVCVCVCSARAPSRARVTRLEEGRTG